MGEFSKAKFKNFILLIDLFRNSKWLKKSCSSIGVAQSAPQ